MNRSQALRRLLVAHDLLERPGQRRADAQMLLDRQRQRDRPQRLPVGLGLAHRRRTRGGSSGRGWRWACRPARARGAWCRSAARIDWRLALSSSVLPKPFGAMISISSVEEGSRKSAIWLLRCRSWPWNWSRSSGSMSFASTTQGFNGFPKTAASTWNAAAMGKACQSEDTNCQSGVGRPSGGLQHGPEHAHADRELERRSPARLVRWAVRCSILLRPAARAAVPGSRR